LSSVLAALLLQAPPAPFPAVIAPAAEGKLQCYRPDRAKKTCVSLTGYKAAGNGVFDNAAEVSVLGSFVMRSTTKVRVVGDRVCGPMSPADIANATILRDGEPESQAQQGQIKAVLLDTMGATLGKEVCTAYLPAGPDLLAAVYVAGARTESLDEKVIWVSPADGYRVAP